MELIMTGGLTGGVGGFTIRFRGQVKLQLFTRSAHFDQGTGPTGGGMIAISRAFMGQFM
jgi:hypothetical protein